MHVPVCVAEYTTHQCFSSKAVPVFSGMTRCQRFTRLRSPSQSHTRSHVHVHGRASWLSAMTDVLTVCGSAGMLVVVVLQGFDTPCISIHYTHVTLVRLYPLAAFCLQLTSTFTLVSSCAGPVFMVHLVTPLSTELERSSFWFFFFFLKIWSVMSHSKMFKSRLPFAHCTTLLLSRTANWNHQKPFYVTTASVSAHLLPDFCHLVWRVFFGKKTEKGRLICDKLSKCMLTIFSSTSKQKKNANKCDLNAWLSLKLFRAAHIHVDLWRTYTSRRQVALEHHSWFA